MILEGFCYIDLFIWQRPSTAGNLTSNATPELVYPDDINTVAVLQPPTWTYREQLSG